MRNFEPFWNRACASCRRTVQRAACVPASALSTATRFVEYRLTDGHSVGAAPGNHWGSISSCSYIKPQLVRFGTTFSERCLSSCSYIKPQHNNVGAAQTQVVYHLVPTSNHNECGNFRADGPVVYHLVPTSNHNSHGQRPRSSAVVYHLVPTSNHNGRGPFLSPPSVVYNLVPTSNHNLVMEIGHADELFIILFLHQTTTRESVDISEISCLSSCSYIKLAKTEHSHPLGMVVSTHFRCGKGVKRGLKNGALPFNID